MYRRFVANVLGLIGGAVLGLVVTDVPLQAQAPGGDGTQANPYKITQTGGWNKSLKCQAQNIAFTVSIDNAAPVAAQGVTYAPNLDSATNVNYPYIATFPQSQFPAPIRTVGVHTLAITSPATTIILADGVTTYTFPATTYGPEWVHTYADSPSVLPLLDAGWKKIIGTLQALFRALFWHAAGL